MLSAIVLEVIHSISQSKHDTNTDVLLLVIFFGVLYHFCYLI